MCYKIRLVIAASAPYHPIVSYNEMKIKLWSIQEEHKIDEITSTGKLVCFENKLSKEWENEYRWMRRQMKKRIGKYEVKNQYPIWAWYQYQDINKRKPDLRRSGHLPSGINGIRIEFEKNKNEILLSDFILWHYPLSYKSIIAKNEIEHDKFELKLKKLKLDKATFEELPRQIQNEIKESWEKIFDIDFKDEYYTNKKDEKMIQACCWDIKEDEIIRIDKFNAR